MKDQIERGYPKLLPELEQLCKKIGFTMPSDRYAGSLLRTLISSKPGGNFLEFGTGVGLSLVWMVDGMDEYSKITTIDNDPNLVRTIKPYFEKDKRVSILCKDGDKWISEHKGNNFDLIFADAWPGKYSELDKTLNMVKVGGFYVIDDMSEQPNWPEGHAAKAERLAQYLISREDFHFTQMNWSTGVMMGVRVS
ncbi:MAG: class I SAM-dependent methyltransferase [Marinoscillum sp.]